MSITQEDTSCDGHLPNSPGDGAHLPLLCIPTKAARKEAAKEDQGVAAAAAGAIDTMVDHAHLDAPLYPRLQYRPDVDGLRALAVVPIVLYHFGLGFPGGFTGVDVFFVISGFLISSIIFYELQEGKFSMRQFFVRRLRRLFPALAAMLVVILVASSLVMLADDYQELKQEIWSVLLGGSNFYFFNTISYWGKVESTALLHCWSLSTEEQFYLLSPPLLWLAYRVHPKVAPFVLLLVVFLVSLTLSCVLTPDQPKFAFYLLPTRCWEMALGGLVSTARISRFSRLRKGGDRRLVEGLGWSGLLAIVLSYFLFDKHDPYPGYRVILPCLGCALFIFAHESTGSYSSRLLSLKLPVWIGKVSYSLYLWHWPIFVLFSYTSTTGLLPGQRVGGVVLSFFVAVLSYVGVENVFRNRKIIGNRVFFPIVVICWGSLMLYALVPVRSGGCDGLLNFTRFGNTTANGTQCVYYQSDEELDDLCRVEPTDIDMGCLQSTPPMNAMEEFEYTVNGGPYFAKGPHNQDEFPSLVVLGSSHATMWTPGLVPLVKEYNSSAAFVTKFADGELSSPLTEWDNTRLDLLKLWQPGLVLWMDYWTEGLNDPPDSVRFRNYDFERAFSLILQHTSKLVVFGDVPGQTMPNHKNMIMKKWVHLRYQETGNFDFLTRTKEGDQTRKKLRLEVEENIRKAGEKFGSRFSFVETASLFTDTSSGNLQLVDPCSGQLAYYDLRGHISAVGAMRGAELFRKVVFGNPDCPSSLKREVTHVVKSSTCDNT